MSCFPTCHGKKSRKWRCHHVAPVWTAISGSCGAGPARKPREDLPIEGWVRLPRLGGYNPSVAHGLIAYIRCPGLLRFQSHVLIAGHTLARRQPRSSQHLDAVEQLSRDPTSVGDQQWAMPKAKAVSSCRRNCTTVYSPVIFLLAWPASVCISAALISLYRWSRGSVPSGFLVCGRSNRR